MAKINIHGDEIAHTPTAKAESLAKRNEVVIGTAMLGVLFIAATIEHTTHQEILSKEIKMLLEMAAANLTVRWNDDYNFNTNMLKGQYKDKCINTKPQSVQQLERSVFGASSIMKYSKLAGTFALGFFIANEYAANINAGQSLTYFMDHATVEVFMFLRGLTSYNRWRNIASGKWAFEDKDLPPKKAERPSLIERLLPNPALQM